MTANCSFVTWTRHF